MVPIISAPYGWMTRSEDEPTATPPASVAFWIDTMSNCTRTSAVCPHTQTRPRAHKHLPDPRVHTLCSGLVNASIAKAERQQAQRANTVLMTCRRRTSRARMSIASGTTTASHVLRTHHAMLLLIRGQGAVETRPKHPVCARMVRASELANR